MSDIIRHGRFLLLALVLSALILPGAAGAQDSEPGEAATQDPEAGEAVFGELNFGGSEGEEPTIELRSGAEAAADQIIVQFKEEAGPAAKDDARSDEGLKKKEDLGIIDAEVDKVEGRSVEEAIDALNARPEVEHVQPDYILHSDGYADEPRFTELWGLHNTGQPINGSPGTPDVDVNGKEASSVTQGDQNLVVAVIDDGVDFSHSDLKGSKWKNPGESGDKETNGIDDDGNGYVDDVNGWDFHNDNNTVYDLLDNHGTHVAGTIAASVNGEGVVGVAPNVKIMALKFLDPRSSDGISVGTTSDAIKAIEYAKKMGAKISNNSWGGDPYNQALKDAIDRSSMLFVAAAGNDGSDNDGSTPHYPSSYASDNILSVAALDNRGNLADFSNYGANSVDISAPGVSVLSSFPAAPAWPGVALSSVGASGKAVVSGFGVEEITGTASENARAVRTRYMSKALATVGHQGGSSDVLLVDDDLNVGGIFPDVRNAFSNAIMDTFKNPTNPNPSPPTAAGVSYGSDGPDLSALQQYETVVWATGQAFGSAYTCNSDCSLVTVTLSTLTPKDRQTLTDFLNGGGKLILAGMDALLFIEDDPFVKETLGFNVLRDVRRTNFNGNVSLTALNGASGTKFAGDSYGLTNSSSNNLGRPRRDFIIPEKTTAAIQSSYNVAATPATWKYFSGTSMATPHATGAAALAASTDSGLLNDPERLKSVLMDNGKPLSNTSGKTVTGDMVDAHAAVLGAADDTPPTGTVLINDQARKTKVAGVTLTLSASDDVGVRYMRFSNDGTNWSAWEDYATSKSWTLSSGRGTKTVFVQFRDLGANSVTASDTIRKISSH